MSDSVAAAQGYRPGQPAAPAYTNAEFAAALQRLLPRGRAWPRDPDAVQSQVIAALALTIARVHARANALLVDAFPATAAGLLTEWEATLGLPDPCAGPSPSIATRQRSVVARLTARGGQSVPYFIAVAAALGFAVTITEFERSRFGRPFGPGRRFGGAAWSYTWQVNVAALTIETFKFGSNKFGDPFRSWGSKVLECTLRRICPAHTVLVFSYSGQAAAAGLDGFVLDRDALA